MADAFGPKTDHEMIQEIYRMVVALEHSYQRLESSFAAHLGEELTRSDALLARTERIERLVLFLQWIGGPVWGLILLALGAILGAWLKAVGHMG